MHTTIVTVGGREWQVLHDGDYEGTWIVISPDHARMEVPSIVVDTVVAEKIRMRRYAELEQATVRELIR
jgi:hypothetical protein